jgi:hypothetical protein
MITFDTPTASLRQATYGFRQPVSAWPPPTAAALQWEAMALWRDSRARCDCASSGRRDSRAGPHGTGPLAAHVPAAAAPPAPPLEFRSGSSLRHRSLPPPPDAPISCDSFQHHRHPLHARLCRAADSMRRSNTQWSQTQPPTHPPTSSYNHSPPKPPPAQPQKRLGHNPPAATPPAAAAPTTLPSARFRRPDNLRLRRITCSIHPTLPPVTRIEG